MQLVDETDLPGRPTCSRGEHLLQVLLFAGTLLAVCVFVRALLPPPAESTLGVKLAELERRKDEIDVVFVGSSQVYRHVDPAVFDATLAGLGREVRSFNLGAEGMGAMEVTYAVRQVLAMQSARLRWVFADMSRLNLDLAEVNRLTGRVTEWHDLQTTVLACALVWVADEPWRWKLEVWRKHLEAFGFRLASVGRVRILLSERLLETAAEREKFERGQRAFWSRQLSAERSGYVALDVAVASTRGEEQRFLRARRRALLDRVEAFERRVDRLTYHPPRELELNAAEQWLFAGLVDQIESAGAGAVLFLGPDVERNSERTQAAARTGLVPVLLDFSNPREYPELFTLERHFDLTHLDEEGGRLYTEALARRFHAVLERAGPERPQ